jgi:hypothetical protein
MGMVALFAAQAQQNGYKCRSCTDYNEWMLLNLSGPLYLNPVLGYKGERFFGNWMKGTLQFENGDSVIGADLRFEKYLGEVLFMNNEFRTGILPKQRISGFTLYGDGRENFLFVKRKIKHIMEMDSAFHFLQLLTRGNMELLVLRRAVEGDPGILLNADAYFICHGGRYYPINLKRRELLKLPFVLRKEMKHLLWKEGIDVKNETGMIKAISAYNTTGTFIE